jgi:spore germination protein
VAAWTRGDLTSLANALKAGAVGEVDIDWWHVRSDGSLAPDAIASPSYVTRARADRLEVFATITNRLSNQAAFDPAPAEVVLAGSQARDQFADVLVDLCDRQDYDGIDIDFESLKQTDRDNFTAFMKVLAQRLHADGKRLSVAVYDKQTDYPTGPEAGARAAENYKALGAVVDEFKVLTFGEHGSFTGPGPLASPEWTSRVLAYAESQVDPAKIWMGVPFFGFDWGTGTPRYLTWSAAQELIGLYKPVVKRSSSGEAYFQYAAGGVKHTVYFQDRTSIERKVNYALAQEPAIAGIAIWVMGIEDPGFWPVIGELLP